MIYALANQDARSEFNTHHDGVSRKIGRGEPGRGEYVDSSSSVVSTTVTADQMVRRVCHVIHDIMEKFFTTRKGKYARSVHLLHLSRTYVVSTRTCQYTGIGLFVLLLLLLQWT